VATIIQDKPRGNHDRTQRWARLERADRLAQYSELHAQGLSQRQMAQELGRAPYHAASVVGVARSA
jgi:hypothetical protein